MPVDPCANFIVQFIKKRETFDEVCEKQRTGIHFREASLDSSSKAHNERMTLAAIVHESFSDLQERMKSTKKYPEKSKDTINGENKIDNMNQKKNEHSEIEKTLKIEAPSSEPTEKRMKKAEIIEID